MIILKIITYSCLLFSQISKTKFKNYKNRFRLKDLVEIHHIIPRQYKKHEVILKTKYDIENCYNLVFLPNKKGKSNLLLNPLRPIHQYGHSKYNIYIKNYLDNFTKIDNFSELDIIKFNKFLRKNIRTLSIPGN